MQGSESESQLLLPGDVVNNLIKVPAAQGQSKPTIKLGIGLLPSPTTGDIIAVRAGLFSGHHGKYAVKHRGYMYSPCVQDLVIGVIKSRNADGFVVDVGAAFDANLSALAFEGATKRNRPNLNTGNLVYARVLFAHKDMEVELSCTAANSKSEGFGELKGGLVVRCSSIVCQYLQYAKCPLLEEIGKLISFEIAIGMNARIWIRAENHRQSVLLARLLTHLDAMRWSPFQQVHQKLVLLESQQKELLKELQKNK